MTTFQDDKLFVQTPLHKKLYRLGVPREFWNVNSKVVFLPCKLNKTFFSKALQRSWYTALTQEVLAHRSLLIVVGSTPTDTAAFKVAFAAVRAVLVAKKPVALYDASTPFKYLSTYPTLLVINSLAENSTPQRLEAARDVCQKLRYANRLVVVASADPGNWLLNQLHVRPDLVFLVKDQQTTHRRTIDE